MASSINTKRANQAQLATPNGAQVLYVGKKMNNQLYRLTMNVFRLVAFVQILFLLMPILSLNLFLILLIRVWALYAVIILLLSLTLVVLARKLKEKKVIMMSRGVCVFYLIIGYLPLFRLLEAFRMEDLPREALIALGTGIGIGVFIVSILFIPCLIDLRKQDPSSRWSQFLSRSALQS